MADLIQRHERSYNTFESVARRMIAEQRVDEMVVDFFDYPQSIGVTILHVVLHMLRRGGVNDPIEDDFQEWEHMTGHIPQTGHQ